MTYSATITDTHTGESREIVVGDWPAGDEYGLFYYWTEGNFGCDCNRRPLFERALDPDYDEDEWDEDGGFCNSPPNRYRVPALTLDDGTRIDIDDAPAQEAM